MLGYSCSARSHTLLCPDVTTSACKHRAHTHTMYTYIMPVNTHTHSLLVLSVHTHTHTHSHPYILTLSFSLCSLPATFPRTAGLHTNVHMHTHTLENVTLVLYSSCYAPRDLLLSECTCSTDVRVERKGGRKTNG